MKFLSLINTLLWLPIHSYNLREALLIWQSIVLHLVFIVFLNVVFPEIFWLSYYTFNPFFNMTVLEGGFYFINTLANFVIHIKLLVLHAILGAANVHLCFYNLLFYQYQYLQFLFCFVGFRFLNIDQIIKRIIVYCLK